MKGDVRRGAGRGEEKKNKGRKEGRKKRRRRRKEGEFHPCSVERTHYKGIGVSLPMSLAWPLPRPGLPPAKPQKARICLPPRALD